MRGPPGEWDEYILCFEVSHERRLKVVRVPKGTRITFGPLAVGGRFPSCFRIYEDKSIVAAFSGVLWFRRKDIGVDSYGPQES